jgi:hypothetical protein
MAPRISASALPLSASISLSLESSPTTPVSGLSLEKRGIIAFIDQFQPLMATPPITPVAAITAPNGITTQSSEIVSSSRRVPMKAGFCTELLSKRSPCISICFIQSASIGAQVTSSAPPAAMAQKCPRSRERAICPSSRAFCSLRGEAGWVRSCASWEAMAKGRVTLRRFTIVPGWLENLSPINAVKSRHFRGAQAITKPSRPCFLAW